MAKKNSNLKSGFFTEEELKIYSLKENEIDIILKYQEQVPILQQEDNTEVNARELHKQLEVGTEFAKWIKRRIEKYGFEEAVDFSTFANSDDGYYQDEKGIYKNKITHQVIPVEYKITLDMAKQLAMVENNEIGILTRKYFIYIEKAFKCRVEWNSDRTGSIEMFHELTKPLTVKKKELISSLPYWAHSNTYLGEMAMLNEIIIGMSATEYRKQKGLKKSYPIRNTFDKLRLYFVHKLELYDATLIEIQEMYNYNERKKILIKYFNSIVDKLDIKIA